MKPTQGQIRIFWEWCGLRYIAINPRYLSYWIDGMGEVIESNGGDLVLDLNNLFKYAVPKLESVQLAKFADTRWHAIVQRETLKDAVGDDPTLTLFWAIWEFIEGEVIKESE